MAISDCKKLWRTCLMVGSLSASCSCTVRAYMHYDLTVTALLLRPQPSCAQPRFPSPVASFCTRNRAIGGHVACRLWRSSDWPDCSCCLPWWMSRWLPSRRHHARRDFQKLQNFKSDFGSHLSCRPQCRQCCSWLHCSIC